MANIYDFAVAELDRSESTTCVMTCGDGVVFSSQSNGVKPLLEGMNKMRGCVVADKVIGRAAALLCIYGKAKAVYARLISEPAKEILALNNIDFEYEKMTDRILNRDKSGYCPMESTVMNICDPKQAYEAICSKIKELQGK